jgi:hypothetical protein
LEAAEVAAFEAVLAALDATELADWAAFVAVFAAFEAAV